MPTPGRPERRRNRYTDRNHDGTCSCPSRQAPPGAGSPHPQTQGTACAAAREQRRSCKECVLSQAGTQPAAARQASARTARTQNEGEDSCDTQRDPGEAAAPGATGRTCAAGRACAAPPPASRPPWRPWRRRRCPRPARASRPCLDRSPPSLRQQDKQRDWHMGAVPWIAPACQAADTHATCTPPRQAHASCTRTKRTYTTQIHHTSPDTLIGWSVFSVRN